MKYLEDEILLKLLKKAMARKDDLLVDLIDRFYSKYCGQILQYLAKEIKDLDLESLLLEAMAEFWDQIEIGDIKPPLKGHLFYHFLQVVWSLDLSQLSNDLGIYFAKAEKVIPPYLESDILAYLLFMKHGRTEDLVYHDFKAAMINILIKRYPSFAHEPEQEGIYDEALADGIDYIRKGKLSQPMSSRLLTFFTHIAWHKVLNWFKAKGRRNEILEDNEQKFELWLKQEYRDSPYSEYLAAQNDLVAIIGAEGDPDLLEKILAQLTADDRRLLELRFIEGYSYTEIAETLNMEGDDVNENALRGRALRALRRARKILNLD